MADESHSKIKAVKRKFSFLQNIPWVIIFRWLIFVFGLAGLISLFPMGATPQHSDLKLNLISPYEIIAPFDFEILKSRDELEQERATARTAVMPIFKRSSEIENRRLTQLDSLLDDLHILLIGEEFAEASDSIKALELERLGQVYRIKFSLADLKPDEGEITVEWWDALAVRVKSGLKASYQTGILDREPETINTTSNAVSILSQGIKRRVSLYNVAGMSLAKSLILENLKDAFPEGDRRVKLGYEIILNFIEPNILYDGETTEERRIAAANKVALAKGIVLKDERIIDSNERVTQEHLDKLRSMSKKKVELSLAEGGMSRVFPLVGKALFSGGILLLLGYLIYYHCSSIATNRNYLLILIILLTPLVFLQVVLESAGISKLLFPAAMSAMLITIFYGYRVGFWFIIALSLLAGAMQGNDYQLCMMSLLVGSVGIVSVKQIRSRTQLLSSALYLGIAYVLFLVAFNFLQYSVSSELLEQTLLAGLNSLMTPIFVLGFAIILGNLFDITTDLTLIELSDLNRPLLKRLSAAAPGTYHHSLMVATLAEASAEAVGANPLLARTASYYHDIGKLEKRDYFIENQLVFNPHDTIPPEESAAILNSHVTEGLELAEKHRLPQVIKDAILQHHGTSLMQYFYHKAAKRGDDVEESEYRYPGPLPVSKESGIIMLADSVEAAVRSMGQVSMEEISQKIKETIENRFEQGQLDHCELSLNDLQIVEESFISTFKAQHHQRINYPSRGELERVSNNVQSADN